MNTTIGIDSLFSVYKEQAMKSDSEFTGYDCHDDEIYYDCEHMDHDDSGSGHSYDDYWDND